MKEISYINVSDTDNAIYQDLLEIQVLVDGVTAGHLSIYSEGQIGYAEVYPEYQNKGLYKSLMKHALVMLDIEQLVSNDRNESSNPCWESWLDVDDLECDEMCYAILWNGELEFQRDSDLV